MWRAFAGSAKRPGATDGPPSILRVALANQVAGYLFTILAAVSGPFMKGTFDALTLRPTRVMGEIGVTNYELACVGCSTIAVIFVALCKRHRLAWSHAFLGHLSAAGFHAARFQDRVVAAYRMSVLGAAAAIFLVFLQRPQMGMVASNNFGIHLEIFLVPPLVTLGFYFVCHALVLRPLYPRGSET